MDQSSSDRLSRVFPGAAGEWIANLGGEKIKQLHVDSLFLPDSEYKAALEKAWALRQGLSLPLMSSFVLPSASNQGPCRGWLSSGQDCQGSTDPTGCVLWKRPDDCVKASYRNN